jgi:DNA-binding NtrC family response regulator
MNPLRVLIVDDEEELVHTLVERLQLRNIEAHGVTTGTAALELVGCDLYDVVLVDVKMPGLGGMDLVRIIKERCPRLQVILLTGHGSNKDAQEGMRLGAFDYLMKPVRLENLLKTLKEAAAQQPGDQT